MFCALLTSRYQVSVYRTNGPLVSNSYVTFIKSKRAAILFYKKVVPFNFGFDSLGNE